jgi:hypothetical protein
VASRGCAQEAATQSEEWKLPPGYENASVGFRRAFEHAKRHGNEDKASLLYAEAWAHDFEETGADDV